MAERHGLSIDAQPAIVDGVRDELHRLVLNLLENAVRHTPPGTGVEAGSTYELQTPVTLLGRGTDCDLRMVDPGVSRHHAELRVEDEQVVLVDLGSTNGTLVNGQPMRRVVLTDGTNVTLGRTTMVFHQDIRY